MTNENETFNFLFQVFITVDTELYSISGKFSQLSIFGHEMFV